MFRQFFNSDVIYLAGDDLIIENKDNDISRDIIEIIGSFDFVGWNRLGAFETSRLDGAMLYRDAIKLK